MAGKIPVLDVVAKFTADTANLDDFMVKLEQKFPAASEKAAASTALLKNAQQELRQALKDVTAEGGRTPENMQKLADAEKNLSLAASGSKIAHNELKQSIGATAEANTNLRSQIGLLDNTIRGQHAAAFADMIRLFEKSNIVMKLLPLAATAGLFGFIFEILAEGIGAIEGVITALGGWDEAAKKAYDDQLKLNQVFIELANQQEEAQIRAKERGLEGAQLTRQQIDDNKAILALLGQRLTALTRQKNATDEQLKSENSLAAGVKAWAEGSSFIQQREDKIKELTATSKALGDQITAATKEVFSIQNQQADKQSQLQHQSLSEYIATETAKTEAKRNSANAQIALDLSVWRSELANHVLNVQEFTALEQQSNEDIYQNDHDALQKKLQLLQLDPTRNATAIITLNGQIESLERQHQATLIDDETAFVEAKKQIDQLLTDPILIGRITLFNDQIEQAEKTHNAALLKIAGDGMQALANSLHALDKELQGSTFTSPIPQKIAVQVDVKTQALVAATDILSHLGDTTFQAAKRAGEASAAYDLLVATIEGGSKPAIESQQLLNETVGSFKEIIRSLNPEELLGIQAVLQENIASTKAWGGSTTELEQKLAAVQKILASIGINIDDIGKRSQKSLSPLAHIFQEVISRSVPAGTAMKQFGNIVAEGIGESVTAALEGSENFDQAMKQFLKTTLATLSGQAVVETIAETAKGFAALSPLSPDFGHAGDHFTSAAIWASVAVAAAAGAAAIHTDSSQAPNGADLSSTTSSPAVQSAPNPVSITNVQHFAAGGLITGRTLAVIGDSLTPGRDSREAVLPLDNENAIGQIAEAVAAKMPGGSGTVIHQTVQGLISPDQLTKVMKKMTRAVNRGQGRLLASNAAKVTKRT